MLLAPGLADISAHAIVDFISFCHVPQRCAGNLCCGMQNETRGQQDAGGLTMDGAQCSAQHTSQLSTKAAETSDADFCQNTISELVQMQRLAPLGIQGTPEEPLSILPEILPPPPPTVQTTQFNTPSSKPAGEDRNGAAASTRSAIALVAATAGAVAALA
jgi:hypothetical protein